MNGKKLLNSLETAGLNLVSVVEAADIQDLSVPDDCVALLMIGNAGGDLWRKLPPAYLNRENPIDEYSVEIVERSLSQLFPDSDWEILYPASTKESPMLNLQKLGRLAGWHNDSPLGSGINTAHGLWFAYRVVVALSQPLVLKARPVGESPCVSCVYTPCVAACPAAALAVGESPNLEACVQYRTSVDSACAHNCIARVSCPVAPECRYSDDQISYHYGRSLLSLREWVAGRG